MKVGIVGAGAVARRGHLPAYRAIPGVEVAAIADRDQELAASVAREFGIPRCCSSCEEMLQDEDIAMVDVCTPTPTHLEIVRTVAGKGRHVLLEKPLASTLSDAARIRRMAAESGIKLCVVLNWRFFPSVGAARARITGGYLGRLVTIHGVGLANFPTHWTLNTWLYHPGGALYDFGPHVVDMVLWMKGFAPLQAVYASGGDLTGGGMDFVNYAVISMEFADGSVATADISWVTALSRFTLDIHGTAGSLFLDVRNDVFSETRGIATPFDDAGFFARKMWRLGTGVLSGNYFNLPNLAYRPLIGEFVKSIAGEGEVPVPVEQAMMTSMVLHAAQESLRRKERVTLEEVSEAAKAD